MKLWLLRPHELLGDDNPWDPWYDKCFGLVIRAETEHDARRIASVQGCEEGDKAWISPDYSTCTELTQEGKEGVIMTDEHWA